MKLPQRLPESGKWGALFAWLNQLRDAVDSQKPLPSHNVRVTHTRVGTGLLGVAAADEGTSVVRLVFKEMQDDYIVCRSWDGTNEGTADIFVAKPPKLRASVTEETLDGIDFEYSYVTTGTEKYVSRTSTNQSDNTAETQKIVPRFIPDDEIFAIAASTGIETVDAESVSMLDLNVDARAWAAQAADA